jgi:hypothetical protein
MDEPSSEGKQPTDNTANQAAAPFANIGIEKIELYSEEGLLDINALVKIYRNLHPEVPI